MNALLIDDERESHNVLSYLLKQKHPEINIQGNAFSVEEGVKFIEKYQPDLLFLDIEMPDGNGFKLLERFQQPTFQVIFVTAHNQYAQTAIRFGALDYLTKPVDTTELNTAILKAKVKRLEVKIEQLENMQNTLLSIQNKELPPLIYISTSKGLLSFLTEHLILIKGLSQGYLEILVEHDDRRLIVTSTLRSYEKDLSSFPRFVRTHRSYIINLYKAKRYVRGNNPFFEMANGSTVPVGKKYKAQILERMQNLGI
ncbi:MAG: LytTR family DNA-binding domain-containing protein [Bacteroidota bacterium]